MKRYLILTSAALMFSAVAVLGAEYDVLVVNEGKDLFAIDRPVTYALSAIDIVYSPALNDADLSSPKFVSNFNRLVVFPELGSASICSGFVNVARGPPKS